MANNDKQFPGWLSVILGVVIAAAGAVSWIEARVGSEAKIRRDADIRIEEKIDRQQQRIEDKLDKIIDRQLDSE